MPIIPLILYVKYIVKTLEVSPLTTTDEIIEKRHNMVRLHLCTYRLLNYLDSTNNKK